MHLVSHLVPSFSLLLLLGIYQRSSLPDVWNVNAAMSQYLGKSCYQDDVLLQWQRREF